MADGFTLYQLTSDYKRFTEMVENGEISAEDMQDTLDGLAEDINTKLDNTCGYIKSLEAQVNALKKAKDDFDERIKQKKNAYLWLILMATKWFLVIKDGQKVLLKK